MDNCLRKVYSQFGRRCLTSGFQKSGACTASYRTLNIAHFICCIPNHDTDNDRYGDKDTEHDTNHCATTMDLPDKICGTPMVALRAWLLWCSNHTYASACSITRPLLVHARYKLVMEWITCFFPPLEKFLNMDGCFPLSYMNFRCATTQQQQEHSCVNMHGPTA